MVIEMYGVLEAAKMLKRHPESIRRACRLGHLNFGRIGRGYRFTDEDLKTYVYKYGAGASAKWILEKAKAR